MLGIRTSTRRGVGMVDTLAVIAMSGTAATLIPAVTHNARVTARQPQCVMNHRMLWQAQAMYMSENLHQYAGLNTSGAAYQGFGVSLADGIVEFSDALVGDTDSSTPTASWDWISPILGEKGRFPANRAARLAEILNRMACPEATNQTDYVYFGGGGAPSEIADFEQVITDGVKQVSYLQPASFQYFSAAADPDSIPSGGPPGGDFIYRVDRLRASPVSAPAISPADFRPVLDRVGTNPASKIMHADGTRFVQAGGMLSLDSDPDSIFYGNFGTGGPILEVSNAYGRSGAGSPDNLDLSFRHDGGLYATMFDGAVRFMTREEAWTDPAPWYPGGSVFTGENATQESIEFADSNYEGVLP